MHRSHQGVSSWKFLIPAFSLVILLSLTIAACGNNQGTTVGSPGSALTPGVTPTATTATRTSTLSGCPDKTQVTTSPPAAALVLKNPNNTQPADVNKGGTVEIDLPFGSLWSGPTGASANLLTAQQPFGYASTQSKSCIWRFTATNTGTATLTFTGRPICVAGEACPQYVRAVSFLIAIK